MNLLCETVCDYCTARTQAVLSALCYEFKFLQEEEICASGYGTV
jgi:hypothetical protein